MLIYSLQRSTHMEGSSHLFSPESGCRCLASVCEGAVKAHEDSVFARHHANPLATDHFTSLLRPSGRQQHLHCRELRVQEDKVTLPRCLERKGKEAKSAETGLLSAFLNMLPHQGCVSKGPESPGHLQSEAPLCWSERILLK